jgi:hypothetical protein
MWRQDLQQKKVWFDRYTEVINQKVDEFYSTVPDSGLSEREQYLYDTAQNQFKMLYELMDQSKKVIDTELMMVGDAIETKQGADTQI